MISNCLLHIILATKYHKINPKILKVVGGGKYRLRPADVRVPSPHLGSIRPSTGQAVSFCFHPFLIFPSIIGLDRSSDSLFLSYRHRPADWAVPPLGIDTSVYGPLFPANAPPFAFLGLQLEKWKTQCNQSEYGSFGPCNLFAQLLFLLRELLPSTQQLSTVLRTVQFIHSISSNWNISTISTPVAFELVFFHDTLYVPSSSFSCSPFSFLFERPALPY